MKSLLHIMNSGQVKYNDPYFRVFAAVCSAQFIVTLLEEASWIELLQEKAYYIAMGVGVAVALLLIYLVYRVSVWLDSFAPWPSNVLKRLGLQCLFGIVVPVLVGVLSISIYYIGMGTRMSQTRYVAVILKIKILLLVLANIYYVGRFVFEALKLRIALKNKAPIPLTPSIGTKQLITTNIEELIADEEKAVVETVVELNEDVVSPLAIEDSIAVPPIINPELAPLQLPPGWEISQLWLVLSIKRVAKVYHRDDLSMPWTPNIKDTIPLLPTADFFRINKSCIVRRENILRAFYYKKDKRNIKLVLATPHRKIVIVGRFQRVGFEKWYGKEKIQSQGTNSNN